LSALPLVLVVDDDAGTRDLVAGILEPGGYEVATAGTVSAARLRLIEETPDLILMDLELPDGDGLTLTVWIKHNQRTKAIPVVALTGHVSLERRSAATDAGCAGFISKPINGGRFVQQVERYLASQDRRLPRARPAV
jgi:two-component system, cell cycle response regulator DivK